MSDRPRSTEIAGPIDAENNPTPRRSAIVRRRKPVDIEMLRALTADMPFQESAGDFVRKMRDTDRA